MNRVTRVAESKLSSLVKISSSLGDIAANGNTSRYDSSASLLKKSSIDAGIVESLDKIASEVASSVISPALNNGLGAFGKSLLVGSGVALPLVAGGIYLLNKYKEGADDMVGSTLDRLPDTIAEVITAGRQAAGHTGRSRKYAELQAAYSLNLKLRDLGESGVKTASELDYRNEVIKRSNAHIADLLAALI